jgi:RimJ/RimL family protein N-acetyltransferase
MPDSAPIPPSSPQPRQAQPVGPPIEWAPVARPDRTPLRGRHVLLRPVDPAADAEPLYAASHPPDGDRSIWTYLWDGPYESPHHLRRMLEFAERSEDPLFFTIATPPGEQPVGIASYQRFEPAHGVIEVGHIWFGLPLQRTTAATEAIYLLARRAFDELGYRRLEWKCDALNATSRRAAVRFGFTFEGVFRQHMVIKHRNRDTAWFAMLDRDWPRLRAGYETWLRPGNFDEKKQQKGKLTF